MDNDTLTQFDQIGAAIRKIVYSIEQPEFMLFDLDSTLLDTYGSQEREGFNVHYQACCYHPLLCFDGLPGDLLKAELREGAKYCSRDADHFIILLLQEYRTMYPSLSIYFHGDSGFASPDIYEACEENDCKYAVWLKLNPALIKKAADADDALYHATIENQIDYAAESGEFMYKADSCTHPRRVVF